MLLVVSSQPLPGQIAPIRHRWGEEQEKSRQRICHKSAGLGPGQL